LLHDKGLLLRNFTQNIDTLERIANIPGDALVEAHGSFAAAHCIDCRKEMDIEIVKGKKISFFSNGVDHVFKSSVPRCDNCGGLVKPDIVFFGEGLPDRFFDKLAVDFPKCDLLLVIGTSLQVQPFASLIARVKEHVPRVLINREAVGTFNPKLSALMSGPGNLNIIIRTQQLFKISSALTCQTTTEILRC
jgi:NAD-dependent deacetylase sirtuin 2